MSIGILYACMQDNFSAIGKGPKSKPIAEQLPCKVPEWTFYTCAVGQVRDQLCSG